MAKEVDIFIYIKLFIDKENNRVVCAEGDQNFVDALFGFLTLPLGTIVKLLNKKSGLGCIDSLYKSVENVDILHLETNACKSMLLSPNSESDYMCQYMKLKYNEKWIAQYSYHCPSWNCVINHPCTLISIVPDTRCDCGRAMGDKGSFLVNLRHYNEQYAWDDKQNMGDDDDDDEVNDDDEKEEEELGVFMKQGMFIVTDDLQVMQSSDDNFNNIMSSFGISSYALLNVKTIKLGHEKVLKLLKASLTSKTPLTDTFLTPLIDTFIDDKIPRKGNGDAFKHMIVGYISSKENVVEVVNPQKFTVNLIRKWGTNEPLYVIARGDFVDFLFSFLTFPLAYVVKLLSEKCLIGLGSAFNIYKSVLDFANYSDCIRHLNDIEAITKPKLVSYYGTSNQLLNIKENLKPNIDGHILRSQFEWQQPRYDSSKFINPKLGRTKQEFGGAFVKEESEFVIANNLEISSLNTISILKILKRSKVCINSLEEEKVAVTEVEALKLFVSCLTSEKGLGGVFDKEKRPCTPT